MTVVRRSNVIKACEWEISDKGRKKMKTQNNKPTNQQKSRNSVTLASPVFNVMAIFIVVLFCSSIFAEADESAVSASKKKSADDFNDEISLKVQKLNERLKKIADLAMHENLDLLTEKQRNRIEKDLERSNRANEKLKKSKGFKEIGKKHKFKPDKSQNNQVNFYMTEADDDDDYDPNALGDFSAMIDDLNEILVEAEEELQWHADVKGKQLEVMRLMANGLPYAQPYYDLKVSMDWSPLGHTVYGVYEVLKFASITADGLYDIATCPTRQTAFGMNASTAGTVFAIARMVCDLLAEAAYIGLYVNEAFVVDNEQECILQIGREHYQMIADINSINGQVVSIQADANSLGSSVDLLLGQMEDMNKDIGKIETKVTQIDINVNTLTRKVVALNTQMNARFDAMTELMNQRFDYIEQLLCTPHGARPKLPKE